MKKKSKIIIKYTLKLFKLIEIIAAFMQGKGYGSATIKQEINQVMKLLTVKPILVIDIGGNVGEYTAELISRHPFTEIHIFEPSKVNIEILSIRFKKYNNLIIIPLATSNKTGNATLYSNYPGSGLASLTQRNLEHFNINFDITEDVNLIRFEEYWKNSLQSRIIDLVKIDIEGQELNTLNGFGESIEFIKILQFEFGGCNVDTRTYFRDFWDYFKKYNFSIYRITPIGYDYIEKYIESNEFFITTNYIAVNNNLENLTTLQLRS